MKYLLLIVMLFSFISCEDDRIEKACKGYDLLCNDKKCDKRYCTPLSVVCKKPMCELATPEPTPEPTVAPTPEPTPVTGYEEKARFHGYSNPDRPTFYFAHRMDWYPREFRIVVKGCYDFTVINNGTRFDRQPHYLVKQSDVSGRGMGLLIHKSCTSKDVYVMY